ncbi:MAG: DUF4271 domain-containing protein [Bacteroidales bacterium]
MSLYWKRDWLILAASLFLFSFLPAPSSGQINIFLPAQLQEKKDSVVQEVEYVRLNVVNSADSAAIHGPLLSNVDTIISSNRKDSLQEASSLLPLSLLHLVNIKQDTIALTPFFFPHSLPVRGSGEINRKNDWSDWAFVIIVTGFLLFAAVQYSYNKRMLQLFKAFLAGRFLSQLTRGSDFYKERITYNLYLIFLLVFPLFLFEINNFFKIFPLPRRPFTEILFYFELFFLNLLIYSVKVLALRATGAIFKTKEITGEYLMTHFIFSLIQGIMVLFFVTIVVYTHSIFALWTGLFFLLVSYAFQLVRGFFIGLKNSGYSALYLILFFFTLEILPLLFLYKVFLKASPV